MNDNCLNQAATTLSTSAGEQQWHKNTTHSLKYKVWHETCGMNSMTFSVSSQTGSGLRRDTLNNLEISGT